MRRIAMFTAAVFAAGLAFSGGALAAGESKSAQDMQKKEQQEQVGTQQQQEGQVAADQQRIQSASDIQGFKIQNQEGEQLGKISELLIDVQEGKVGYAVISSGGLAGMGEEQYIVPFNALKPGIEQNVLTLDVTKDQLKEAPQGDVQQALDQQMGREIHQFYGVSPYWEEGAQQDMQQQEQLQQEQQQPVQQEREKI